MTFTPETLRDLSFRITSYNQLNKLDCSNWVPLKLAIMVETYKTYPEPTQQKDIAEKYNFHVSSISRCIKHLIKDGFVHMKRLSPHTNNKGIYLTKDGLECIQYVLNKNGDTNE